MSRFDKIHDGHEHRFVRENPKTLKHMFGTDEVTSFWIADMDFKIAAPITEELQRIVNRGIYAYEFAPRNVFNAIVNWNAARHQLFLDAQSFIQAPGVLTGISIVIRELTEPGDGVLIQSPVYHQFAHLIKANKRTVVKNPLQIADGAYKMDFEDLEQKLQDENVKIILLCNPHNPIGRVWKKEEMAQVVTLANKYGATIISDEVHSDIIYPGHRFNSIASVDQGKHIALIGSPTKTFGMQSISGGYIYIPDSSTREKVKSMVGAMYLNHGNALTTFATIAAFKHAGPWLDELLIYLEKNVQWINAFLKKELPGVGAFPVEGTYQIWLDFRGMNISKEKLSQLLLEKAKLALTPGDWFGEEGNLFMRLNFACPLAKLQNAFRQIQLAFSESI